MAYSQRPASRACPTETSVSRTSATRSRRTRTNWPAICSALAGVPWATKAARTALNCSASSFGQDWRPTCVAAVTTSLRCTGAAAMRAWSSGRSQRILPPHSSSACSIERDQAREEIVVAEIGGPNRRRRKRRGRGRHASAGARRRVRDREHHVRLQSTACRSAVSPERYKVLSGSGLDETSGAPYAARSIPPRWLRSLSARAQCSPEMRTDRSIASCYSVGRPPRLADRRQL